MYDFDAIRKQFYKRRPDEELQNILYKLISLPVDNKDIISNSGVDANPILSSWIDDLLYQAKRRNNTMSPAEAIQDDECLQKILDYISTKPSFFKLEDEEDTEKVVNAIKTYFRNSHTEIVNATKVANFSAVSAKKIYEKYCPKYYATILDYSCGWGARMLGCLSSPYEYKYIGIEPNSKLNERLHEFSQWICDSLHRENNTQLYLEGSEVFHEELVNTVDLSFSSPPYFNLEIYCDEESQSANKDTELKDWVNHYMIPTLKNIYKYTKVGGYHIVNLKNISKKEPLLDLWGRAALAVGFKLVTYDYLMHQSKRQFDKNKKDSNYKGDKEPIAIFQKVS